MNLSAMTVSFLSFVTGAINSLNLAIFILNAMYGLKTYVNTYYLLKHNGKR